MVKQGKLTAMVGIVCPMAAEVMRMVGLTRIRATDILQWRDFLGDTVELIPAEIEEILLDRIHEGLRLTRRMIRRIRRLVEELLGLLYR